MTRMSVTARGVALMAAAVALVALPQVSLTSSQSAPGEFNDSHFHLTNYVQKGIDVQAFLGIMGSRVARSTPATFAGMAFIRTELG